MDEIGKLVLIMPEDCSIWLEEKHPRVVKVLQWLIAPAKWLAIGTGRLSFFVGNLPSGRMSMKHHSCMSFLWKLVIGLLLVGVSLLVWALCWLLKQLVGLFWRPTPEMVGVVARRKAAYEAELEAIGNMREKPYWDCPVCGTQNHITRRECTRCAHPRDDEKPAAK